MDIKDLLDERCLLTTHKGYGGKTIEEFRIIEISPSGNWTKLMNIYGNKFWKPTAEILLVEKLVSSKAEK